MADHQRPICPHCNELFERLAVWVDENKQTAIFFCPSCSKAFGAQLLIVEAELNR